MPDSGDMTLDLETHERHMAHCLALGKLALAQGNPPVGSILVHENRIIGEGIEAGKTTDDLTNHAEILVVRDAIARGNKHLLASATLYSTHEPCVMCSYLIRHHQIPTLVYGTAVDFVGGHTSEFKLLKTESVPKWGNAPQIISGILESKCEALNQEFRAFLAASEH